MSVQATGSSGLAIDDLRSRFRGHVIGPNDPDYDGARSVMYGGIDKRPAAIVQVVDADEVAQVVSLARDTGLELAVRGGGHSVA